MKRIAFVWLVCVGFFGSIGVCADSLTPGLSEVGQLPGVASVTKIEYCPEHDLLFLLNGSDVRIVLGATGEVIDTHAATETFTDMDLTSDGRYLFVADYGGERTGYGTPINPHYVHRYDLQDRRWVISQAPKIAWKIEAVASDRVLLQEHDQHVDMTLNSFGSTMTELSRIRARYYGDLEYDPVTKRAYHGSSGSSSRSIHVRTVKGDALIDSGDTGVYGTAQNGGGTCVLSTDGSFLYYGKLQVDAMNVRSNLYTFPEYVYAASPKIAFGKGSYYSAETGTLLEPWGFTCGAVGVSEDGQHVWAYDTSSETMFHYIDSTLLTVNLPGDALEGDGLLKSSGSVSVVTPPDSDLIVALTSSAPDEVKVPESITLRAGETNVKFDIVILDDTVLDGSQSVTVSAVPTYGGYPSGEDVIIVHDTESAMLTVVLPQTTYEGAGSIAGAVLVNAAPVKDVVIELASNNSDKIGSGRVILPAGQTFVSFSLPVFDNAEIDGVQTATIEARVQNWQSSQASIFVFDNETNGIDLQLPNFAFEGDGILTNAATVTLSGIAQSDIHVLLTLSEPSEIRVPSYVTILSGQSSASFDISVLDDTETDGMQRINVLAQSAGYVPASQSIDVRDNDVHHLLISEISEDPGVLEAAQFEIVAATIDGMTVSSYSNSVSLTASGDDGNVPVTPLNVTNFVGGTWSGDVAFGSVANNVTLTADDGAGHSDASTVFNVLGSQISLTPNSLTNTLVIAGETLTRAMVISNAGNVDLEFEIIGANSTPDPIDPSLVAHYPFSGDANDESGNGHDGTVNGATLTTDQDGNADSAYHFDGVNDCVVLSNDAAFAFERTDAFSMSFWIRTSDTSSGGKTLIAKMEEYGTARGWNIMLIDGHLRFYLINTYPSNEIRMDGTSTLTDNKWHHIAVAYDGSSSADGMVLYVDGEVESAMNVVDSLSGTILNNLAPTIGMRNSGFPFEGYVDDVCIYSREISASEVAILYGESGGQDTTLVAYFPFNGNANDESGDGNNGTVVGATLTTDRNGNVDSAYDFDGVNDYINLGTMGGFKTVSMWVNQGVRSEYDYYLGHNNFRLFAYYASSGRLAMHDGTASPTLNSSAFMDSFVGEWIHVVAISDGLNSSLYVNGENVSITSPDCLPVSDAIVNLGRWPGGSHYFNGKLDDVRIYDRALSASEVSALYAEDDGSDAGLVGDYPFSGHANDESGNGHDGTVNGAVLTTNRQGVADSAYYFDGINDQIILSDEAAFDFESTSSFTHSLWFKSDDLKNQAILSKIERYNTMAGYSILLYNGTLRLLLVNSHASANEISLWGTQMLADGLWHHLAISYNGSSQSSGVSFYIDGVLETKVLGRDTLSGSILNDVIPTIGSRAGEYFFHGDIDDIRIYNRALSEADIMGLYLGDGSDEPDESLFSVSPAEGTIPPGSNMTVSVGFDASGLLAGDSTNGNLMVFCNDVFSLSNTVPASMWVLPTAPMMGDEPESTPSVDNTVAWSLVEGPVEYLTEALTDTNSAAVQQSGWVSTTNHTFNSLAPDTIYYYHARASVMTAIGRLDGPWSGWVQSRQLGGAVDLDGDLIPDEWEVKYFGAATSCDPLLDPDGDGQNNRAEFIAGMDPLDADSCFKIGAFDTSAGDAFLISWDSVTGRVYSVYWKTNMLGSFLPLETDIHYPRNSYTDSVYNAESQGFYSIKVELDNSEDDLVTPPPVPTPY